MVMNLPVIHIGGEIEEKIYMLLGRAGGANKKEKGEILGKDTGASLCVSDNLQITNEESFEHSRVHSPCLLDNDNCHWFVS